MNAERLLVHYEQIADAPDAMAMLRRFILDLAVRGKLVPQDASDEPASELLKRIAKEKASLVKEGKAKRQEPLPEVDFDQAPFDLPAGWAWGRFPELGTFGRGKSKHRPRNDPALFEGGEHLMIQTGDVARSKGVIETYTSKYNDLGLAQSFKWPKGTLCITIAANIADSGILSFEACFPDSVVGFVPASMFHNAGYFEYFVRTAKANLLEFAPATAQKNINLEILTQVLIPLPPLAEQHRIVAKVDELMSLCDRLEAARASREATRDRLAAASLARLNAPDPETFQDDARFALDALPALTTRPDQIKALRQTILNLAVRGKLVQQHANDEPASELLKRIAKERTAPQAIKKARRNGQVEISSLRADLPLATGWRWTNIDEIALSMRYGTSTKCEYATPGVPVLRIPNVSDGVVSLDDIKFGPLTEGEIRDLALNAGDLLMIRSNGSLDIVGRSAVVTPDADGMAFAGYLVRLRLSLANTKPEYIWLALNSTDVRDQIERPIRSAVGLKNVNLTEFGALTFPLPPLAEQHRIVAKVDALMALCDRLEASLTATAATRRRLLDALRGEALAPAEDRELKAAE
ncbi:restriction endonuclease subunit S [Mesorhizobium sp.]|uniref:restriction endonuclease subunit S n=1 Tax=Mesorhizobium sp. TaxID=1871066 RepID=UPI000FEA2885|nr:restriction endonuclease subunit S [Mesorhizobium sp.]RWP57994.1 MAG: restriction endonuclease subunit S [Mesorhizobium sp.]